MYHITKGQRLLFRLLLNNSKGINWLEDNIYRIIYKNKEPKTYWFFIYGHLFLGMLFLMVSIILLVLYFKN
jgi:hypothetical protein